VVNDEIWKGKARKGLCKEKQGRKKPPAWQKVTGRCSMIYGGEFWGVKSPSPASSLNRGEILMAKKKKRK
jgi:hypothetical protein